MHLLFPCWNRQHGHLRLVVSRLAHRAADQHWVLGELGVGSDVEGGPLGMIGIDGASVVAVVGFVVVGPAWGAFVGSRVVAAVGVGPD
jgi:hypothetical protein